MNLDCLIIADSGTDSVSDSSSMRFAINGQTATIQAVTNYLSGNAPGPYPVPENDHLSWNSAPKLNGIALLSSLLQHGYQAALVNDFAKNRETFHALLEKNPRAIIISTTFIVGKPELQKLSKKIRSLAPGIPIIAGGPFVAQSFLVRERRSENLFAQPEIQSHYLFWDHDESNINLYVTTQHNQGLLHNILDRIRDGQSLENIPNTAWQDSYGVYHFGPKAEDPFSERKSCIDWDGLPDEIFASKVIPLQASAGCPYRCAFCNFVHDKKTTYAKEIENIITEMTAVAKRGVKYVWFVDDIFRLGRGNLAETSQAIIDANLNLKWMTFIRADTVKDVDFELLKAAGCHELQFGLESADPDVLAAMNKKANPDIYRSSIQKALAAGINISAYFLFGYPGETQESVDRTIAFMQEIQYPELPGSLSWSIYPFILIPLSPIYEAEQRQHFGLDGYMMDWQHNTMDSRIAKSSIKKAIMTLNDSAPIYRDDNLAMLDRLDPVTRKAFFRARLQLAKLAAAGNAKPEIIYQTFSKILQAS